MLTRTTLNALHELTANHARIKDKRSEILRTAQDRYGHRVHKVPRPGGEQVEISEKVMWDEVFYLGVACESGKALQKIHPDVFKGYADEQKAADELKKFTVLELGLDFTALTLSDYLKMTEALFHLMLEENRVARYVSTEGKAAELEPYTAPELSPVQRETLDDGKEEPSA